MRSPDAIQSILGTPQQIDIWTDIEMTCIYCPAKLPSKSREHLFNACWGGTHKSSKLICDDCNAAFSRIDGCFRPFTDWIMNAHGFRGSRDKEIPLIHMGSHNVAPYGRLVQSQPRIDESTDANGNQRITAAAGSRSEMRSLLLDGQLEKAIGRTLSPANRDFLLKEVARAEIKEYRPDPLTTQVTIDLQSQYRAAAHTILKVLKLYESNLWCDSSTEKLRSFARTGSTPFQDIAVEAQLPMSVADLAKKHFNYRNNSIEIYWSHCERKVFGILTLLGRIKRALVVSESWLGPNAIMVVGESVHAGAKLRPLFWEFPPEADEVPIITVSDDKPTLEQVKNELGDLINESQGWHSIASELGYELSRITSKGGDLTPQKVDRIEHVLSDTLRRYAVWIDRVMDKPAAVECLRRHDFRRRIEKFLTQPIDSPDMVQAVGDVLVDCLDSVTKQPT